MKIIITFEAKYSIEGTRMDVHIAARTPPPGLIFNNAPFPDHNEICIQNWTQAIPKDHV